MSALPRRGQPLAVLGLVLASWIGVRAAVWEPPFALPGLVKVRDAAKPVPVLPTGAQPLAQVADDRGIAAAPPAMAPAPVAPPAVLAREQIVALVRMAPEPLPLTPTPVTLAVPATTAHVAAAHQLLYLAALGRLPLPPGLALAAPPRRTPPPLLDVAAARWSGDGWVLVREGSAKSSGSLAAASGFPAYGASQAGGVIRYALAPGSARAPQAYLRLSRAIGGFGEGEVAAGLSVRPFVSIPLRLLGEARVQRGTGITRVRPTASLVSELPQVRLPLRVDGEAYAQIGYVGGKQATPFFDVQVVADRKLVSTGPAELRIGAGAWSGGQKGATRLDIGPRASLRLDTAPARSRLALDWRFRVAGNARPASGPTLTFSAGF